MAELGQAQTGGPAPKPHQVALPTQVFDPYVISLYPGTIGVNGVLILSCGITVVNQIFE